MAGVLTLAMILATVIEKFYGAAFVSRYIYCSPVTVAIWTLTVIFAAFYILSRRRMMSASVLGLHASLCLILVGAAVTWMWGRSGILTLTQESPSARSYQVTDHDVTSCADLPFKVTLVDFETKYYPATSTPADFITRFDVDGCDTVTVSMNNVADVRGYRFYQTGMGPSTTTLSVQHDPWGIGITYAGYLCLFAAMICFFTDHPSAYSRAVRLAAIMIVFTGFGAYAAPRAPQKAVADRFGTLLMEYNGRVAPVSTFARDFCLKVCGTDSYEGLTPEQTVTGLIFYYDDWKREPFIKIKGENVRRALGVTGNKASLADFYTGGGFALDSLDQTAPDVRAANEKVSLVTGVLTGALLRIYPVRDMTGLNTGQWISWVDRQPAGISLDDWRFVRGSMEYIARELMHGRDTSAWDALGRIREQQRIMAGDGAPSQRIVAAEIFYNRYVRTLPPAVCALAAGLAGLFLTGRRSRIVLRIVGILIAVALLAILCLRMAISGHLPLSNGYETMLVMALCASVMAAVVTRRGQILMPLALIVCGLALGVSMMSEHNPAVTSLMPVLSSPLLSIHVLTVMIAYALLAVMAVNSAIAWRTGSAERTALSLRLLYPAAFLLAAGIFTGAVWANMSWGRYWGWDPKETWALITLIVYALPMHRMSWPCFRRRSVLNGYLALAFVSVLITYFGVNFFMSGLHSYAGG